MLADKKSVILSGLPVSGKSTLARRLADELGMPILSAGRIWRETWEAQHPRKDVSFEDFWRGIGSDKQLEINTIAKNMSEKKSIIGEFRYVSLFDRRRCLLVFLDAGIDIRAIRALGRNEYSHKGIEEIKRILRKREEDEVEVGISLFGADYREPSKYDLVMNTGSMDVDEELYHVKGCLRNT